MRRRLPLLTLPLLAALGLAACGSSSSSSSTSASTPASNGGTTAPSTSSSSASSGASSGHAAAISADPSGQLAYNTTSLHVSSGKVVFSFTNQAPLSHNFTILKGSATVGATPTFSGGTKALTVTLKPGTYTFECTVPGHAQAGMKGTLTVS
jgi:plastocyanin